MNSPRKLGRIGLSALQILLGDSILRHNGVDIREYPEKNWWFAPFPAQKGKPFSEDNLATTNSAYFCLDQDFSRIFSAASSRWPASNNRLIRWRLHIFIGLADFASRLNVGSEYVELGVGKGFMTMGLLEHRKKSLAPSFSRFLLYDSFQKDLPEVIGGSESKGESTPFYYADSATEVTEAFAKFEDVHVIQGLLPDTLETSPASRVGFIHVDLNDSRAEIASLDKVEKVLLPNAPILFDDSGNPGASQQLFAHRRWLQERGLLFTQLPTGQLVSFWQPRA